MGFPGEELVTTAIEKFADGVIHKMDAAEERRNREFSYKLKELEYYKGNYDKEIRTIFEKWFDFLENTLVSTSTKASEDIKRQRQKKVENLLKYENAIRLKIDTMKYGGTETGKALALFSQLSYDTNKDDGTPKFAMVYAVCKLLSTLKKEILGQEISPLTILKILLNDYDEAADMINESRAYVEETNRQLFGDEISEQEDTL